MEEWQRTVVQVLTEISPNMVVNENQLVLCSPCVGSKLFDTSKRGIQSKADQSRANMCDESSHVQKKMYVQYGKMIEVAKLSG